MPLNIGTILTFIPTNVFRPLKKLLKPDKVVTSDGPFLLSTKYTPALLVVMLCLSLANQFVRNVEIDCSAVSAGQGMTGWHALGGDNGLNDYCWNHDTFLVAKALEPEMQDEVAYPGVMRYKRGKDQLIKQSYYKQVWLILGKLAVLAFIPYFMWKGTGKSRLRSLLLEEGEIETEGEEERSEEEVRVAVFVDMLGFNGGFALFFLTCKILATLTPVLTWLYLQWFLGPRYRYYGWDVVIHSMKGIPIWPDPMDALFPRMAKCEWAQFGAGGDIEPKPVQCQLPMNGFTRWSFFLLWWWSIMVLLVNFFSSARLLFLLLCPPCRRVGYRSFVQRACRADVERARNFSIQVGGQRMMKKYKKSDIVDVDLGFGDWLVLSLLKRNLEDWQFREFIRTLAVTENPGLQLRPMPLGLKAEGGELLPKDPDQLCQKKGGEGGEDERNTLTPPPLQPPPPAGFLNLLPPYSSSPNSLPSYSACGGSTPSSTPHNELLQVVAEEGIKIRPPVKLARQSRRGRGEGEGRMRGGQVQLGFEGVGGGGRGGGGGGAPPPPGFTMPPPKQRR